MEHHKALISSRSITKSVFKPHTTTRKRTSILVSLATMEKKKRGNATISKRTLKAIQRTRPTNQAKRGTSTKVGSSLRSRRLQNRWTKKIPNSTRWAYSRVIAKKAWMKVIISQLHHLQALMAKREKKWHRMTSKQWRTMHARVPLMLVQMSLHTHSQDSTAVQAQIRTSKC